MKQSVKKSSKPSQSAKKIKASNVAFQDDPELFKASYEYRKSFPLEKLAMQINNITGSLDYDLIREYIWESVIDNIGSNVKNKIQCFEDTEYFYINSRPTVLLKISKDTRNVTLIKGSDEQEIGHWLRDYFALPTEEEEKEGWGNDFKYTAYERALLNKGLRNDQDAE